MTNRTICVIDSGNTSWAERLSQEYERVLYWRGDPTIASHSNDDAIGAGFGSYERITDKQFWAGLRDIDTFCFLDVGNAPLAKHLRDEMGFRVWSGFDGEELEQDRVDCKEVLKKVGLSVPKWSMITGIDDLRSYLYDNPEQVVKVSRNRRLCETFLANDWQSTDLKLDGLQAELGGKKWSQEFLVEEVIDAITESGYDGYCIDGEFPKKALTGCEIKSKAYAIQVIQYDKLSKPVLETNERLKGVLKDVSYRQFWHTEIRVTNNDFFPIDFTCRIGTPPSELMQELITNWAEIIEAGVQGELVEPNYAAKFGVEAIITCEGSGNKWAAFNPDKKVANHFRMFNQFRDPEHGGFIVPDDMEDEKVGTVVAIGDSLDEAIKKCRSYTDGMKGFHVHLDELDDAKKELAKV